MVKVIPLIKYFYLIQTTGSITAFLVIFQHNY